MSDQCPPKRQLVASPEILEQLNACCSTYDVEETDDAYVFTADAGDGNGPTVFEVPKPGPCEFFDCATAPDGTIVVISIIEGVATYSTVGGGAWNGDPGVLV